MNRVRIASLMTVQCGRSFLFFFVFFLDRKKETAYARGPRKMRSAIFDCGLQNAKDP